MQHRARHNPARHSLRLVALAALLGASTIALSQCRMVTDNVTGIRTQAGTLSGRSRCTHQCNDTFEESIKAEETRHHAAMRACGSDKACRDNENKLNDKNRDQISEARKACKRGCYNEGGGHS